MNLNNVSLWFGKNEEGKIITIDKLESDYKGKYYCPLCGSEIIPKALESEKVSAHFAHIYREQCSGETIIHWWVKNELIKVGDVFEVETTEKKQYLCKGIEFEKEYETPYGMYRPDASIDCGDETIFVEVNYTNKKNVDEYFKQWEYLKNTVIEFDIRSKYDLKSNEITTVNTFKSIYHFGIKDWLCKHNAIYNDFIGSVSKNVKNINMVGFEKIRWFIDDIYRYNTSDKISIYDLYYSFSIISKENVMRDVLIEIYKNSKCQSAIKDVIEYIDCKIKKISEGLKEKYDFIEVFTSNNLSEKFIKDKLFKEQKMMISIKSIYQNEFKALHKEEFEVDYDCGYITITVDELDKFEDKCNEAINDFYNKNKDKIVKHSEYIQRIYKFIINEINNQKETVTLNVKVREDSLCINYYIIDLQSGHKCKLNKYPKSIGELSLWDEMKYIKKCYNDGWYKHELEEKKYNDYKIKKYIEVSEISKYIYEDMSARYNSISVTVEYDNTNKNRYFTKITIPKYDLYIFFKDQCADVCTTFEDYGTYPQKTRGGYRWRTGLVSKFKTLSSISYDDGFEDILNEVVCKEIRDCLYGGKN